jgi:hypothetical protein
VPPLTTVTVATAPSVLPVGALPGCPPWVND